MRREEINNAPSAGTFNASVYKLRELYELKRSQKPGYTLRAFAKYIGISPTALSQIFLGKRPLTLKTAAKVADRCLLSSGERRSWMACLVENQMQPNEFTSKQIQSHIALDSNHYWILSEWYYYAILALCEMKGHSSSPVWLSKMLGISQKQARHAVLSLIRAGFVKRQGIGLCRLVPPIFISSPKTDAAIKGSHQNNLALASRVLETSKPEQRYFQTYTMLANSKSIEKAKRLVEKFKDDLAAILETGERDQVYTLAVQLFPISKNKKEET